MLSRRQPILFAVLTAAIAVSLSSRSAAQKPNAAPKPPSTVRPEPRGDKWWQERHAQINDRLKKTDTELVFIGDSITQGWEGAGRGVWEKFYGSRKAVNMGISGDQTQHVLWRLDHGNFDLVKPKLAVLMIGTNNSKDYTAEEIAAGIKAIVKRLREKQPQMKILVLAIFPRAEKPDDRQREKNAKASEIASKLADGQMVHNLDIGPKFLTADGILTKAIMPDLLHLNEKSYAIWAEAIEPKVKELLDQK